MRFLKIRYTLDPPGRSEGRLVIKYGCTLFFAIRLIMFLQERSVIKCIHDDSYYKNVARGRRSIVRCAICLAWAYTAGRHPIAHGPSAGSPAFAQVHGVPGATSRRLTKAASTQDTTCKWVVCGGYHDPRELCDDGSCAGDGSARRYGEPTR